MLERNEIYRALLRQPSILGLPLLPFVLWLCFTGFLFMWVQSFFIIVPIIALYLGLFVAAKWDQNFFNVLWITASKIKRSKNIALWGGNSYEP